MSALKALAVAASRSPPLEPPPAKRPRTTRPRRPVVVWFRGHDLRVNDHPALANAFLYDRPIVGLFILEHDPRASPLSPTLIADPSLSPAPPPPHTCTSCEPSSPAEPQRVSAIIDAWNIRSENDSPNLNALRGVPSSPEQWKGVDTGESGDVGTMQQDVTPDLRRPADHKQSPKQTPEKKLVSIAETPQLSISRDQHVSTSPVSSWSPNQSPAFALQAGDPADVRFNRQVLSTTDMEGSGPTEPNLFGMDVEEVEPTCETSVDVARPVDERRWPPGNSNSQTSDARETSSAEPQGCAEGGEALSAYSRNSSPCPPPGPMGRIQRWRLHHSLVVLSQELGKLGLPLVFTRTPGSAEDILLDYVKHIDAYAVLWNKQYIPYLSETERSVKQRLDECGVQAVSYPSELLVEPKLRRGLVFDDFHSYMHFWFKELAKRPPPAPVPITCVFRPGMGWDGVSPNQRNVESLGLLDPDGTGSEICSDPSRVGCIVAEQKLQSFMNKNCFELFGDPRLRKDALRTNEHVKTSRLSSHIRFGEISPRAILNAVERARSVHRTEKAATAAKAFLKNMSLRDFGYHMLTHHPYAAYQPIVPEFQLFPWREDPNGLLLASWKTGTTGYPIVDAAMRQLSQEGWIHNRLRFFVASFLCKYLLLPWPFGADWLLQSLIDGDEACNSLGWQWTVGCNSDSFPFSTLVNPVSLAKHATSPVLAANYIRRYVPELRNLPEKFLFTPWRAPLAVLEAAGISLVNRMGAYAQRLQEGAGVPPQDLYPIRVVQCAESRHRAREGMSLMRRIFSAQCARRTIIVDQKEPRAYIVMPKGSYDTVEMSEVTGVSQSRFSGGLPNRRTVEPAMIEANAKRRKQGECTEGEKDEGLELSVSVGGLKQATNEAEVHARGIKAESFLSFPSRKGQERGDSQIVDSARGSGSSASRMAPQAGHRRLEEPGRGTIQKGRRSMHQLREHPRTNQWSATQKPMERQSLPTRMMEISGSSDYPRFHVTSSNLHNQCVTSGMTGQHARPTELDISRLQSNPSQSTGTERGPGHYSTSSRDPVPVVYHSNYYSRYPRDVGYGQGHTILTTSTGSDCNVDSMRPQAALISTAELDVNLRAPQEQFGRQNRSRPGAGGGFNNFLSASSALAVQAGQAPGYTQGPLSSHLPGSHHNAPGSVRYQFYPMMHPRGGVPYMYGDASINVAGNQTLVGPHHQVQVPGYPYYFSAGSAFPQIAYPHGTSYNPSYVFNVNPSGPQSLQFQAGSGAQTEARQSEPAPSVPHKPETPEERTRIAHQMAAMNYHNHPEYGNKLQEQWQLIAMHVLREYELTNETNRETSRDFVRLRTLKNELQDAERPNEIRSRAKVTVNHIKEFFKILNLPVTGEWDRRGHGGTRGPYVYGICKKGENRLSTQQANRKS